MEQYGDLKWHTKRVKRMRHLFKNYFLMSIVAYTFIFLQTIILCAVFWYNTEIYFRYVILIIVSIFQFMCVFKLNEHLGELDKQVNYRITRYRLESEKRS